MKRFVFIIIALVVYQKWGAINHYLNPPPDFSADHSEQVILYSTSWCGYCKKARALLEEKNVSYYEYDIETSDEGRRQYERLGGKGVPVLLINGEVIKGYSPTKMLELLGKS